MCKSRTLHFKTSLFLGFIALFCFRVTSGNLRFTAKDTSKTNLSHKQDKIRLLAYMRVITDAKGAVRVDENIVPNFRLLKWLKLEAGIRFGQRPQHLDSYYHYKLELQTKSFWKIARIIARISDNVINYPNPNYIKTNELFLIEAKYLLSPSFQCMAAGGYVFSSQHYNDARALPTNSGIQSNYPTFKLAMRYILKDKGFIEVVYGSYDVFNPYEINRPFMQINNEYELSHLCTLYSYLRYQYDYSVFRPYNYFLGLGLMFHLVKT